MGKHVRPRESRTVVVTGTTAVTLAAGSGLLGTGLLAAPPGEAAVLPVGTAAGHDAPGYHLLLPSLARPSAAPGHYTVQPGDYLSAIAAKVCGKAGDWPALWHANPAVTNPDLIYPGSALAIACKMLPGWAVSSAKWTPQGDHEPDGDGDDPAAQAPSSPPPAPAVQPQAPSGGGYGFVNPANYSGMTACILTRESGGNSQVMNSTGHYGLFQFGYSTWVGHGGNPATFGHATIQEQFQVYYNTVAVDGYSDWSPYDGC